MITATHIRKGDSKVRIDVKGRNVAVTDELREHVAKRCRKMERQLSPLAELEVELHEERNPSIADAAVAEAVLHVKGTTLRSCESGPEMRGAITACLDGLAVQVKRHRDKRRARRRAREEGASGEVSPAA